MRGRCLTTGRRAGGERPAAPQRAPGRGCFALFCFALFYFVLFGLDWIGFDLVWFVWGGSSRPREGGEALRRAAAGGEVKLSLPLKVSPNRLLFGPTGGFWRR